MHLKFLYDRALSTARTTQERENLYEIIETSDGETEKERVQNLAACKRLYSRYSISRLEHFVIKFGDVQLLCAKNPMEYITTEPIEDDQVLIDFDDYLDLEEIKWLSMRRELEADEKSAIVRLLTDAEFPRPSVITRPLLPMLSRMRMFPGSFSVVKEGNGWDRRWEVG